MTKPAQHPVLRRPLLEFVLRHAHVRTNICTFQKFEHGGFACASRTVPDYNLIYTTRGRPKWVIAGEEVPLEAGDLLLVPPGVEHFAATQTKRLTLVSLHVEVRLPGGQDVFELLALPRCQRVNADSLLAHYLHGAMAEFARSTHEETLLRLTSWNRLIVLELLADNAAKGLLTYHPIDPLVTQMLDELSRLLDRPVTLNDLVQRSGYSAQHLNRIFRSALGVTPLQYLARLRAERAAALLMDGRLTIRAVAARLGFSDPYYFSRMFRQHHGQSPAQYRKAIQGEMPSNREHRGR